MHAITHAAVQLFQADTCALFERLVGERTGVVLLESKDGDGRNDTQSLLLTRSALCLEGRGREVRLTAGTAGGRRALAALLPRLARSAEIKRFARADTVVARFPRPTRGGTDAERLRAPSTVDVLRLASRGWERGGAARAPLHLLGAFAYDFVDQLEQLPPAADDRHGFPDFVFWLPEQLVIVNHEQGTALAVAHGYDAERDPNGELDRRTAAAARRLAGAIAAAEGDRVAPLAPAPLEDAAGPEPEVDLADDAYAALVERCQRHIVAGDVFQIVPSRTFRLPCPDPVAAYRALRRLNPSPYLFLVRHGQTTLFGSSPETCVSVRGRPLTVSLHPIAGTRPRGIAADGSIDRDLDSRLEAELRLDGKELAEHMMLVDLARNDVARISRPGSRRVARLAQIERYSHVMHLASVVEGTLSDGLDALHAYLASANMGTLVGAPKIEAAALLRRYEPDRRGPYGGAVGYLTAAGELETAIVIRAALVADGVAHVRAGAGVVLDSNPLLEARETRHKAEAVLRAVRWVPEVDR